MRTRKTPNTDTFYALKATGLVLQLKRHMLQSTYSIFDLNDQDILQY